MPGFQTKVGSALVAVQSPKISVTAQLKTEQVASGLNTATEQHGRIRFGSEYKSHPKSGSSFPKF